MNGRSVGRSLSDRQIGSLADIPNPGISHLPSGPDRPSHRNGAILRPKPSRHHSNRYHGNHDNADGPRNGIAAINENPYFLGAPSDASSTIDVSELDDAMAVDNKISTMDRDFSFQPSMARTRPEVGRQRPREDTEIFGDGVSDTGSDVDIMENDVYKDADSDDSEKWTEGSSPYYANVGTLDRAGAHSDNMSVHQQDDVLY